MLPAFIRRILKPEFDPHRTQTPTHPVSTLRNELDQGSSGSLSLVAPPHFLGVLRAQLDKKVQQAIQGTFDRDLVHVAIHELKTTFEEPDHARHSNLITSGDY